MQVMKLKLTPEQREIFKRIGAAGGKAGSREKKSASAKARWAKARKTISPHNAGD